MILRCSVNSGDEFDSSDNGRRTTSVMEDGKLKIKTVSDSPEIRNLSDNDQQSASESDDGTNSSEASKTNAATCTAASYSRKTTTINNNKASKKLSNNSCTLLFKMF
jgi:hypothetical protein